MNKILKQLYFTSNRHAGTLLVTGLAAILGHNWRLWRRERTLTSSNTPSMPNYERWLCQPTVSILVAAWNEFTNIDAHLQSFLMLRYPHKQLVICAGGNDGTYERACSYAQPDVIVLRQQPGEGKQRALQRCLPLATGNVVMLSDADCEFNDVAFERLLEPLAQGSAQVVTGVSEPKQGQRHLPLVQYQWFTDQHWAAQLPPVTNGVLGRNTALLRCVLERIGAFDAVVRTGTDYHMSRLLTAAHYPICTAPHSRIATDYPATVVEYVRMWRRWNKNLLVHGLHFRVWLDFKGVVAAWMLYSGMLLLAIGALVFGPVTFVVSVLLFSWATVNRMRRTLLGVQAARTSVPWLLMCRLPFYTMLDMVSVLLAVYDTVHPRQRGRW